ENRRTARHAARHISSPLDVARLLIRACDAAQHQLQDRSPGNRRQLQALVWNQWIVELSSIMKSHGLPGGRGVTSTKTGIKESRFGKLVRALMQHALPPGNWTHQGASVETLDQAIKRALDEAVQGRD